MRGVSYEKNVCAELSGAPDRGYAAGLRVLPPSEVLSSRSGICIETALLVASALQSANMNAMIIITPGHAQVALETWEGSGEYYLLETTKLPFTA